MFKAKIRIVTLTIFLICLFFPLLSKAADIDQSSPEAIIRAAESAFYEGNYDLYNQLSYHSPEFKKELKKQGVSWQEYEECIPRIMIYAHEKSLDRLNAFSLKFDRIEVLEKENISGDRLRMKYKIYFSGENIFKEAPRAKDDESYFILKNGKWYFDINAEMEMIGESEPNFEYCPSLFMKAMDLSKKTGRYVLRMEKDSHALFKVGNRAFDVVSVGPSLMIDVGELAVGLHRYHFDLTLSYAYKNLLDPRGFDELNNVLDFAEKITDMLESAPGDYFTDIQYDKKQLTLPIDDYKKDLFTFKVNRDYFPNEKKLGKEYFSIRGGLPVVLTVSMKDNSVSDVLDEQVIQDQEEGRARVAAGVRERSLNTLSSDFQIILFTIILLTLFTFLLQVLFSWRGDTGFKFSWQNIGILVLALITAMAHEVLVRRYVQLGAADIAVSSMGWPFGLIFGMNLMFYIQILIVLIASIVFSKFIFRNKWKFVIIFSLAYTFFALYVNTLIQDILELI